MVKHHQDALRVLRYVKSALAKGLFFPAKSDKKVTGFADAYWGSCLDIRRSVIGFCFLLWQALISWKCKKQPTVTRSSSEVEYKLVATASYEAQWLSFLS